MTPVIERVSTGTFCGRLAASLASSSPRSLPGMPQWAGTHCSVTRCPVSVMLHRKVQTVAPCRVVWVLGPPATVARAAWESVYRTTAGPVARSPATVLTSSSAVRIAMNAARVLKRRLPAATRISRRSTDLMMTSAPPPPRETPLFTEPSLQIQVESIVDSGVDHESIQRGGCSERPRSQIGLGLGSNSASRRSGSSGARDSTELRIRPAINPRLI